VQHLPAEPGHDLLEIRLPAPEWERGRCLGFEEDELYRQFREWQEAPHVKTAKQLRREAFRQNPSVLHVYHFRKASARHK